MSAEYIARGYSAEATVDQTEFWMREGGKAERNRLFKNVDTCRVSKFVTTITLHTNISLLLA